MTHTLPLFDAPAPPSGEAGFGALETSRGCLPLAALYVRGEISGLLARTVVRQTFRNAFDEPLEATYIFPLPDRAAVTRFRLTVAGRVVEGELKERGQAREEYEQALEQGHRAAIAEEERSGTFTMRVGNIPPREEATVELELVGPLEIADDEATFRFPLVVAPRYTPGVPLEGPPVGDGTAPDTAVVPDASRVSPPVLLPGFPNPVRLALEVELDPAGLSEDLAKVRCTLHTIASEELGPPWKVRLQPGERLDRDFILRFPIAATHVRTALQCGRRRKRSGNFRFDVGAAGHDGAALPAARSRIRPRSFGEHGRVEDGRSAAGLGSHDRHAARPGSFHGHCIRRCLGGANLRIRKSPAGAGADREKKLSRRATNLPVPFDPARIANAGRCWNGWAPSTRGAEPKWDRRSLRRCRPFRATAASTACWWW